MTDHSVDADTLLAGDFSVWLRGMQAALAGDAESDVPCGECTACCRSSQFVHVGPDEVDALAHIPAELLFPAPMMPEGHVLMGYDEHGCCPMLTERGCSIYDHRPRTCRTYDCRVFPAAGVAPDGAEQQGIAERTRRWRFEHPHELDRVQHQAVRAAAAFVDRHRSELPATPPNTTQLAVAAVRVHDTFLCLDAETSEVTLDHPAIEEVAVALRRGVRDPE